METPASIGRYPIERALGSGAFASVWLGRDDQLDSFVAIKVLADNWAAEPAVHERFVKEARILRQADSPRIVQVHDIGELPDGRPYFVMTYADMGTLAGRLAEGPLPVDEALRIIGEIAEGVEVLHRLGIVHRDLKPSNVLFRSLPGGGERLMVADLGVARSLADATSHTIAAGSPGYMAPEQMRMDGAPDERADVHGLGAMAYHLLTGQVPGSGAVRLAPHRLREEVPERVSAAIMKAIDPDPDQRWAGVSDFVAALRDPSPERPSAPPPSRDRRPLLIGAGAAVVAAALVVGVLFWRSGSTPAGTPSVGATALLGLREDQGIPAKYRTLILKAGTWCDVPGLSPALIAGILKVSSDFDPDLSDQAKDEYGIARWTPRVLWFWQPNGNRGPIPEPPFPPEMSLPAMGRFFCGLGPQIQDVPGDPAAKLAALYVTGVQPVKRAGGVPPKWKGYVDSVLKYRDQYQS
ncbi:serine/threonine-protein kinase [Nonomuraea sediminis]|uniref:serine/threonine-protein kinase n=1 Tax=Nonomuraea sediminis TaxID=2835864 RepID=UPI001BDD96D4|nr:serine/threonine-protein kinase [Nonomuraea sediminis]